MDLNYKEISNLNERNYKKLLKNYKFNQEDATSLKSLKNMANNYSKELLDGFYEFIFEFDHAKMFLHNKEILTRHERGIKNWYLNLFCGLYDESYFEKLNIISEIHVRIGLPAHYVNAAFSYVRGFLKKILIKEEKYEFKMVRYCENKFLIFILNTKNQEKNIINFILNFEKLLSHTTLKSNSGLYIKAKYEFRINEFKTNQESKEVFEKLLT